MSQNNIFHQKNIWQIKPDFNKLRILSKKIRCCACN